MTANAMNAMNRANHVMTGDTWTIRRPSRGRVVVRRIRRVCGAALALPWLGIVSAAPLDAVDRQVRQWAATCAPCHGTEGRSVGLVASLAGRPADQLYDALAGFRSGVRPATVMHQHAKGWSDDELRRLADYFATRDPR